MLNHLVTQLSLVAVAVVSSVGGIYSAIISRRHQNANADKAEKEAEQVGDSTWIKRLEALNQEFNRLQQLSDQRFERLVEIEMLITEHVSWDFKVIRHLRQHGIEIEDPPSLVYVRKKLKEAQEQEKSVSSGTETVGDSA